MDIDQPISVWTELHTSTKLVPRKAKGYMQHTYAWFDEMNDIPATFKLYNTW